MIIRSPEPEVKILVDRDPIKTSFEEWARPGHFSRTIAKGPDTTTWIWNLHADAHDFDSHTSDLEEISRKVFSAHFGQLSIIFLWLSGMYFHGARFSNYEAWLSDPTHIGPSAQVVWPIVGQEILNGDVGGGFRGIQITSGFFQIWRASGITSELQLYCTAIGALIFAALMLFAGGNFAQSSITINGWLRDFLWAQASQVIQSYGSSLSAYGLFFLGAHFVWAFSLMFLFSGRGYWQELIESIVWAHNKLKVAPATQPRALSIVQGRAVGVTHYLLGGIATTWAFFLARIIAVG
ncbi:hypothetical protein QYF36_023976 [Acer negundo]|nr:hypothetical protein QYF36_023976 [Acer negundo]